MTRAPSAATQSPVPRRSRWAAAGLSLLLPGLGHLYLGQGRRGFVGYATVWAAVLVVLAGALYVPWNGWSVVILTCAFLLALVAFDAARQAVVGKQRRGLWYQRGWMLVMILLAGWGITIGLRDFVIGQWARAYTMPTAVQSGKGTQ